MWLSQLCSHPLLPHGLLGHPSDGFSPLLGSFSSQSRSQGSPCPHHHVTSSPLSLALFSCPGAPLCSSSWLGPLWQLRPSLCSRTYPRLTLALRLLHFNFSLLKKLSPAGFVTPSWPHPSAPCLFLEGLCSHLISTHPLHVCVPSSPASMHLCWLDPSFPQTCHRGETVTPAGEYQASLYLLSKPQVS